MSASTLIAPTAAIVAAFAGRHALTAAELPGLIADVHQALERAGRAPEPEPTYRPAVPVGRSITTDAILSLIDGKPYRTLKRHLARHGLTAETYRERYGLRHDYPMVAPSYAAKRSELAKAMGLGASRRKVQHPAAVA